MEKFYVIDYDNGEHDFTICEYESEEEYFNANYADGE